ncbi:PP2C family protein-serine/threonine phosphatase [Ructibacterium gallinarum]|uniref:Serine/threonine-protein phosphatase n=1 Tax=Ructibacterium gallinarum TaxID=2779355 RepID=A0A9D5M688_9FIRM|nr:protein phosphatase 2C domain-containing protein [Ructibacterium gallinarum]MBE5040324.1 serine/threonine-protein phosphatase [Ructibacterium gallinarum]
MRNKQNHYSDNQPDEVHTLSLPEQTERLYVLPDNAQHIGSREEQQDYFSYTDLFDPVQIDCLGCTAVMADGMGGLENGREAAVTAVNEFLNSYTAAMNDGAAIQDALFEALQCANTMVCQYAGAGATCIGAVVKENHLHWISVGDSHLYLFRKGLLRQLNQDHVYASELDDLYQSGLISKDDALNHPERKALTSYLGMPALTHIDQNARSFPLRMGDKLLLCSDGLYQTLSEEEMINILTNQKDDVAQTLVDTAIAKQKPGQDNVTAVLMKII